MAQTPGGRITRSRSQTPAAVPTVSVGSSTAYGAPGRAKLRTQVTSERQTLTAAFQTAKTSKAASRAGSQALSQFDDQDDHEAARESKTPSRRGRPKAGKRSEPTIEEEPEDEQFIEDGREADDAARRQATDAGTSQRWTDRNGIGGPSHKYSTAQMTGRGAFAGPAGRPIGVASRPLFETSQARPGVTQQTFIDNDAIYGQANQNQQAPRPARTNANAKPDFDRTKYEPSWMETFLRTLQRWTPAVLMHATSRAAKAMLLLWWAILTMVAILTGIGIVYGLLYLVASTVTAAPSVKIRWSNSNDGMTQLSQIYQNYFNHANISGDAVADVVQAQGAILAIVMSLSENMTSSSSLQKSSLDQQKSSLDQQKSSLDRIGVSLHDVQTQLDAFTQQIIPGLVDDVQTQLDAFTQQIIPGLVDDVQSQLEAFRQQILPGLVVVTKDENGDLHLPEHFMQAFAAELKAPNSTLYKAFLETNQAQIDELLDAGTDSAVHGKLREQMHIISREMVQEELEAQYTQWEAGLPSKMMEVVKREVEIQLEKAPGSTVTERQKDNYIRSVFFTNQAEFFGHRNYFAYNAGALIDLHLTSPTYVHDKSWFARRPNPPVTALTQWEEAGDCWCGANNTNGFLQLAIHLRRPVVARDVFFEHIHRSMTDDIAAAPREIEFWGEGSGAVPPQDSLCKTSPPTEKHVCLGVGEYDIHGWNWVQKFLLDDVDFAVDGVVVRVLSNWGADHTCIYRVRLHGEVVAPQ